MSEITMNEYLEKLVAMDVEATIELDKCMKDIKEEEEVMESGDMLYFWAEEQEFMVTMANEKGVRAYNVGEPEFTDDGNVKTRYYTYEELDEVCSYMGNVRTFN